MVLFKRKTRLKISLLIWLTVVNLLIVSTYAWNSYQRQKEALITGIDNQLRAAAQAIPRLLPGDFHDRVARGEVGPDEHLKVTKMLTDYADAARVFYVYSFLVDPEGNFTTASTSATENDWAEKSIPNVGDPYSAPAVSKAVMRSGVAAAVEATDEFGNWRSYLLPLRTAMGQPYLAGADLEISYIQSLLARSWRESIFIGLVGFLLATVFTYGITSVVSRDILRVVDETTKIAGFELDGGTTTGSTIVEVDQLMRSVEDMKSGLRSFSKYVPADLVRDLLLSGQEARLGGRKAELTVLFSDLADFTSLSEIMSPEALVAQAGEYLGAMSEEIASQRGTVDKYIGDSIMAFWGAPDENPHHALDACRAALHCQEKLKHLNARWQHAGQPLFRVRTGLHTGPLIVGNLGSENRLNYTVIGDTVNIASRLEGLNKFYNTAILISEQLAKLAGDSLIVRPVDCVALKGRRDGIIVLELLGLRGDQVGEEKEAHTAAATQLWKAYRDRDWKAACKIAEEILKADPDDGATRVLSERCLTFLSSPPPPDWNGTWKMTEK